VGYGPGSNLGRDVPNARKAAAEGAEIIASAQVALQTFFPQHRLEGDRFRFAEPIPGPIKKAFQALAAELGVVIVINLFEKDGERAFDSSPVIDADGALLGVTRMMHITHYDGFYEQDYYDPGDSGMPVYNTKFGKIGVCICYDRHYPEYLRALALGGAEIVIVPQAGAVGEWPEGVYEAELMAGSFQNGFYMALANRVGKEDVLTFAGESFITDPEGRIVSRAPADRAAILFADLDGSAVETSHERQLFMRHRRSDQYQMLNAGMTETKGSKTPTDHQ